jgi:hypothetical protein
VASRDQILADLVAEVRKLTDEVSALRRDLAARDEEIAKLKAALEATRRSGKRQAAPFSKGEPKKTPKKPGRKKGKDHGPAERRRVPERVDEVLDVPLPCTCPGCGGGIVEVDVQRQFQTELPKIEPPHPASSSSMCTSGPASAAVSGSKGATPSRPPTRSVRRPILRCRTLAYLESAGPAGPAA